MIVGTGSRYPCRLGARAGSGLPKSTHISNATLSRGLVFFARYIA